MNRYYAFTAMFLLTAVSLGQTSDKVSPQQTETVGTRPLPPAADAGYRMRVSSDEVGLIFHAADKAGRPVTDLKPSDLDLFDNEQGPGQIIALRLLKDRPLRVGLLLDTSGSVSESIRRNRTIALKAAKALMKDNGDSGVAVGFGRAQDIVQPWTTDLAAVASGLERIGSKPSGVLDGTSLFDNLWSTCFYQFREQQGEAQNVLLLFTDGLDTSSHASLEQAVGACQQAHASVFVFTSPTTTSDLSSGHRTLSKLADQTGGGLIQCDGTEAEVNHTVEALAADIRSEYQLFYHPKNLKHDGLFHRVTLVGPPRVATIVGQSGYYALDK